VTKLSSDAMFDRIAAALAERARVALPPIECTCAAINHDHVGPCSEKGTYRGGSCTHCRYYFLYR